jgi:membrane-associated phospholipid phosphatase
MAWKIHTGEVPKEYVNETLYDMIKSMNLSSPTDFTAYPEGCPNHPSWPAMHSAKSTVSLWLAVVANLTDEQYCQALLTDYIVSYARTYAGVHFKSDNLDGLNLVRLGTIVSTL